MDKFSKIRKITQFSSLAISSVIIATGLYGILIHDDYYFEIGLLLIGAMLAGYFWHPYWEDSGAGGSAREARSLSMPWEKYRIRQAYLEH
ncbi:MAG: hypothetical protein O8C64_00010 [Candidatus Methanoperedens sp.]|nr:hypothetical protein [Candidatus Methanoperedens sp.]